MIQKFENRMIMAGAVIFETAPPFLKRKEVEAMNKRMAAGLILLALLLTLCGCNRAQETSITVMSQNLRVDSSSDGEDNNVFYRSDRLIWLLEQYRPDVVGMQEYTSNWDFMLTDFLEESDYQICFRVSGSWRSGGHPYSL